MTCKSYRAILSHTRDVPSPSSNESSSVGHWVDRCARRCALLYFRQVDHLWHRPVAGSSDIPSRRDWPSDDRVLVTGATQTSP
eukprot:53677-Eustigmatos_ZCMA.PRE.1